MSEENKKDVVDLSYFLPSKAKEVEIVEAVVSKRFTDNEGNLIPFKFKPITTERIDQLEKLNTRKTQFKGRQRETVDHQRFLEMMAIESTVYPDFRSEELRQAYKTEDPVEVAKKILHVGGEYMNWIDQTNKINGFDDSIEELEEMAKN